MPIYEFYCDGCDCVESTLRPVSECAEEYRCFNCGKPMIRIYSAPALLNRSKPGSFKWEPRRMSPWDDRVAHLKSLEEEGGSAALRKARSEVGEKLYRMTLNHKKEKYG